tara:strand:+ start:750 stop:1523 length:774 start_codon:yes stop_codon:yes gene_type:complete
MNKIGLFGDSFAEDHLGSRWHHFLKQQPCWMHIISADSYGVGGTDILNSFLKFKKHHSKYNQVVFVLTDPNRMTLYHNAVNDYADMSLINASSLNRWKLLVKEDTTDDDPELIAVNAALSASYQALITNDSFINRGNLFYQLLVDKIKQIRPDVKFIEAFYPGIPAQRKSNLHDIFELENRIMNWNADGRRNDDARVGHFTIDTHIILGELINKWLATDEMFFDFDIKEFENIKPDEKKYQPSLWNTELEWIGYYNE